MRDAGGKLPPAFLLAPCLVNAGVVMTGFVPDAAAATFAAATGRTRPDL